MNAATPSRTSQAVALVRATLDRPGSAEGDPDAQRQLCEGMGFSPPEWLWPSIEARTRFVDDQVQQAISAGVSQIVICGAGYDDRALRFRTAGVRFFELDHPDTQADKARRLRGIGGGRLMAAEAGGDRGLMSAQAGGDQGLMAAETGGDQALTLATIDFRHDDVASVLASNGHDASKPTLFVCEGLLVYLDQPTCHELLASLAACAAPGSRLVASMSAHADGLDSAEVVATANSRRRTARAEPWRTILPVSEQLALVERTGWTVAGVTDGPASGATVNHGRRSLLVCAVKGSLPQGR